MGILHQNADLIQFAAIFRRNPALIPRVLVDKVCIFKYYLFYLVNRLHYTFQLRRFFGSDYIPELPDDDQIYIPHWELDINIDGVQVFDNSQAPGTLFTIMFLQTLC